MTRLLLAALLFAAAGGARAQCPEELIARARQTLAETSRPDSLEATRDLVRRARVAAPSLELDLLAADIALAAGDDEEAGRLAEEIARTAGELLDAPARLTLARRAESRGDRKGAILQLGHVLTLLQRQGVVAPVGIVAKIRRLDAEEQAGALVVHALPAASPEAQEAFASGRAAAEKARVDAARESFRRALRLSPGYVEAAIALGALETRQGKTPEAIAAYRTALTADPDRFEAVLSLANLLWAEPDRGEKEESLKLLDRAIALRPDLLRLRLGAVDRFMEWGDAARALERLDAYRVLASPAERSATDALRQRLASRLVPSAPATEGTASGLPDLSSPALAPYRLAQIYVTKGDEASYDSALELLAEAERLDPRFAAAPALAATVHEKRGDLSRAEAALRRARERDPSRATTHERLAALLSGMGRTQEAEEAWTAAEKAGSREALFRLAERAESKDRMDGRARGLYELYLEESPDGPHADEARAAVARLRTHEVRLLALAFGGASAALLLLGCLAWFRLSGETLESWLAKEPDQAREIRPLVGRLRHEVFKHGGLLLADAAGRLEDSDSEAARSAARLLSSRFTGSPSSRGIVEEAERLLDELAKKARARGFRLNARHKDPILSDVHRVLAGLSRASSDLASAAEGTLSPRRRRALRTRLRAAADVLSSATGARLGKILDDVSSTTVTSQDLEGLLAAAAVAIHAEAPPLSPLGLLADAATPPRVRVPRADWETIWRNLFANALATGVETRAGAPLRLAVLAETPRDPITGQPLVRLVLLDNDPRPLTTEMIRGRAAERGLGIVADLVRKNEGLVEVGPLTESGYVKGIVLELPALEGDVP